MLAFTCERMCSAKSPVLQYLDGPKKERRRKKRGRNKKNGGKSGPTAKKRIDTPWLVGPTLKASIHAPVGSDLTQAPIQAPGPGTEIRASSTRAPSVLTGGKGGGLSEWEGAAGVFCLRVFWCGGCLGFFGGPLKKGAGASFFLLFEGQGKTKPRERPCAAG